MPDPIKPTQADWIAIAKAAGEHGVRYRTNSALIAFLKQIIPHCGDAQQAREQAVAWQQYNVVKPEPGQKIVLVCDDGCSSSLALMTEEGPLDGEDAFELGETFLRGAIWMLLPDDYPIAFMEIHDDY